MRPPCERPARGRSPSTLQLEKYISRGGTPPASAVLRCRRSIAMRLVKHERLALVVAERGEDYSPTSATVSQPTLPELP